MAAAPDVRSEENDMGEWEDAEGLVDTAFTALLNLEGLVKAARTIAEAEPTTRHLIDYVFRLHTYLDAYSDYLAAESVLVDMRLRALEGGGAPGGSAGRLRLLRGGGARRSGSPGGSSGASSEGPVDIPDRLQSSHADDSEPGSGRPGKKRGS